MARKGHIGVSDGLNARALIFLMRVAGLGLRFVLVIYLARYFGVEAVGQFGYLQAIVVLAPPLLGLGLHFRINREIRTWPDVRAGSVMRDKFVFILSLALPLALLGYVLVGSGWVLHTPLSSDQYLYVTLISLLETLATESYLVMISLNRILAANVTTFLRSAIWIVPFVAMTFLEPQTRSIQTLMQFWAGGLLLSHAFLAWTFRDWPWRAIAQAPRNHGYIFGEFQSKTLPVYLSDLSMVGAQYLDRFVLGAFLSLHEVGVYTFFWSIANGVSQLMLVSFVQPALPRLIDANESQGHDGLLRTLKQLIRKAMPILGALCVFSGIFVYVALPYLHRPELPQWFGILALMLVGVLVKAAADIVNYALYVMRKDRWLIGVNVFSIAFALSASTLLIWLLGMYGAALSVVLSAMAVLALRTHFVRTSSPPDSETKP